LTDL
jgi:hypothetical protein